MQSMLLYLLLFSSITCMSGSLVAAVPFRAPLEYSENFPASSGLPPHAAGVSPPSPLPRNPYFSPYAPQSHPILNPQESISATLSNGVVVVTQESVKNSIAQLQEPMLQYFQTLNFNINGCTGGNGMTCGGDYNSYQRKKQRTLKFTPTYVGIEKPVASGSIGSLKVTATIAVTLSFHIEAHYHVGIKITLCDEIAHIVASLKQTAVFDIFKGAKGYVVKMSGAPLPVWIQKPIDTTNNCQKDFFVHWLLEGLPAKIQNFAVSSYDNWVTHMNKNFNIDHVTLHEDSPTGSVMATYKLIDLLWHPRNNFVAYIATESTATRKFPNGTVATQTYTTPPTQLPTTYSNNMTTFDGDTLNAIGAVMIDAGVVTQLLESFQFAGLFVTNYNVTYDGADLITNVTIGTPQVIQVLNDTTKATMLALESTIDFDISCVAKSNDTLSPPSLHDSGRDEANGQGVTSTQPHPSDIFFHLLSLEAINSTQQVFTTIVTPNMQTLRLFFQVGAITVGAGKAEVMGSNSLFIHNTDATRQFIQAQSPKIDEGLNAMLNKYYLTVSGMFVPMAPNPLIRSVASPNGKSGYVEITTWCMPGHAKKPWLLCPNIQPANLQNDQHSIREATTTSTAPLESPLRTATDSDSDVRIALFLSRRSRKLSQHASLHVGTDIISNMLVHIIGFTATNCDMTNTGSQSFTLPVNSSQCSNVPSNLRQVFGVNVLINMLNVEGHRFSVKLFCDVGCLQCNYTVPSLKYSSCGSIPAALGSHPVQSFAISPNFLDDRVIQSGGASPISQDDLFVKNFGSRKKETDICQDNRAFSTSINLGSQGACVPCDAPGGVLTTSTGDAPQLYCSAHTVSMTYEGAKIATVLFSRDESCNCNPTTSPNVFCTSVNDSTCISTGVQQGLSGSTIITLGGGRAEFSELNVPLIAGVTCGLALFAFITGCMIFRKRAIKNWWKSWKWIVVRREDPPPTGFIVGAVLAMSLMAVFAVAWKTLSPLHTVFNEMELSVAHSSQFDGTVAMRLIDQANVIVFVATALFIVAFLLILLTRWCFCTCESVAEIDRRRKLFEDRRRQMPAAAGATLYGVPDHGSPFAINDDTSEHEAGSDTDDPNASLLAKTRNQLHHRPVVVRYDIHETELVRLFETRLSARAQVLHAMVLFELSSLFAFVAFSLWQHFGDSFTATDGSSLGALFSTSLSTAFPVKCLQAALAPFLASEMAIPPALMFTMVWFSATAAEGTVTDARLHEWVDVLVPLSVCVTLIHVFVQLCLGAILYASVTTPNSYFFWCTLAASLMVVLQWIHWRRRILARKCRSIANVKTTAVLAFGVEACLSIASVLLLHHRPVAIIGVISFCATVLLVFLASSSFEVLTTIPRTYLQSDSMHVPDVVREFIRPELLKSMNQKVTCTRQDYNSLAFFAGYIALWKNKVCHSGEIFSLSAWFPGVILVALFLPMLVIFVGLFLAELVLDLMRRTVVECACFACSLQLQTRAVRVFQRVLQLYHDSPFIDWLLERVENADKETYGERIKGRRPCLWIGCVGVLTIGIKSVVDVTTVGAQQALTNRFGLDSFTSAASGSTTNTTQADFNGALHMFDVSRHWSAALYFTGSLLVLFAVLADLARPSLYSLRWSRGFMITSMPFFAGSLFAGLLPDYTKFVDVSVLENCGSEFCDAMQQMTKFLFGAGLSTLVASHLFVIIINLPWTLGRIAFFLGVGSLKDRLTIVPILAWSTVESMFRLLVLPATFAFIYSPTWTTPFFFALMLALCTAFLAYFVKKGNWALKYYALWSWVLYLLPLFAIMCFAFHFTFGEFLLKVLRGLFLDGEWAATLAEFTLADVFISDLLWMACARSPMLDTKPWEAIKNHVSVSIASNDNDVREFIFRWLAHLAQFPTKRMPMALVLRGGNTRAKRAFARDIVGAALLRAHFVEVSRLEHVTVPSFRASQRTKSLVLVDHGKFTPEQFHDVVHKMLMDDRREEVQAFFSLMFIVDNDWTPAPPLLRDVPSLRYLFVDLPCEVQLTNDDYTALSDQLSFGQVPFRDYLLQRDVTDFDPYKVPKALSTYSSE